MRDQRRLAAIVSADVVGYSLLMGRDDSATLAGLKAHRQQLIDPKIAEYGGRIVNTAGDSLLLEFPSVVDAVRCAVDVQRGMAERNADVPAEQRIDFRIGINVGDIIIDGENIFGDGVNVAARLQSLADPGGICVSRVVRDQVLDKLSFTFEDLGAKQVKNIARPVEVYRVDLGSGTPQAQSRGRKRGQLLTRDRAEDASIASTKSVNPAAYDLYLRAKTLRGRAQNIIRAIELYEQAIVADPGYASAYGALATGLLDAYVMGLMPRSDAFPRAQRAADRAIELDPEDLDAIKAQYAVTSTMLRDFSAAERIIRRVLERAPNDAGAHSLLGRLLSVQGRFDEAIVEARRAVELDPQSGNRNSILAEIYYGARKFDDCIEQAHKTLDLDPGAWGGYNMLAYCYDAKGNYEEGAKAEQRIWVLTGEDPVAAAELVTVQSKGGFRARVRFGLAHLLKQAQHPSQYWGGIATAYALLGDKERAFASLERAYQEYDPVFLYLEQRDWDALRDDPRWLVLLRRLNLDKTPMAKFPAAPAPAAR